MERGVVLFVGLGVFPSKLESTQTPCSLTGDHTQSHNLSGVFVVSVGGCIFFGVWLMELWAILFFACHHDLGHDGMGNLGWQLSFHQLLGLCLP